MLAHVKSHSCVVNSNENLRKWENQTKLAESLAIIEAATKDAKENKKKTTEDALRALAPDAKVKLAEKNGEIEKLTKKHICSLLLVEYGTLVDESKHLKPKLVDMLMAKMAEARSKAAQTESQATAVVATPAAAAPAAASTNVVEAPASAQAAAPPVAAVLAPPAGASVFRRTVEFTNADSQQYSEDLHAQQNAWRLLPPEDPRSHCASGSDCILRTHSPAHEESRLWRCYYCRYPIHDSCGHPLNNITKRNSGSVSLCETCYDNGEPLLKARVAIVRSD
jgi:hypothetical protein